MSLLDWLERLRSWVPVPRSTGRPHLLRWFLLEANRYAVSGVMLTFVFCSVIAIGTIWTFEMQRILTETEAVQTILAALLRGNILVVTIVVSVNSIFLSHDLSSVQTQEKRVQSVAEFRQRLSELSETGRSPVNPDSFLELMAEKIAVRAHAVQSVEYTAEENDAFSVDVDQFVATVERRFQRVGESRTDVSGAEFGILWEGLTLEYGDLVDDANNLRKRYDDVPELQDRLDELLEAFELFAIGKEYFKTLYYSREIAQLSRVLLIVTFPAILTDTYMILGINAGILPNISLLGISPLLTLVAVTFTISLLPYIVLTAYMLRLTTVARETSATGPFSLER